MSTDSFEQAIISLGYTWTIKYSNIAGTALIVYDYSLTFPDEVRLIWRAKWSAGKAKFFLARYLVFVESALILVDYVRPYLRPELCKPLFEARAWITFAGVFIAGGIILMRVHAIWGARRGVLIFLIISSLGLVIFNAILLGKRLRSLEFTIPPFPGVKLCVLGNKDRYFINYVLIMAFEFIMASMTFWKWFSEWRHNESSLAKTIFEDSLRYFICLFAISFANVLVITTASAGLSMLLFMIQRAFHSILSARVLLNLHRATDPDNAQELSDMSFAGNRKNYADDVSLSQIDFGGRIGSDSYASVISQAQITEPGSNLLKDESTVPRLEVQIPGWAIGDDELYQVVYGRQVTEKHV